MHTKSPWEDLTGVKRNSLRMKSQLSLIDCIEFHKLTFFSVDAAERLKYYMMCSVKKPIKSTIRMHVTRMETLNKYLGMLPTIKNSPLAVASTEFGNIPFTEATHASIILSHLPVAWRHQYGLMHKTVPESPRGMLLDLKNIEKLFVERYNEKARASKAKAATAQKQGEHVPRKGKREGGSLKEPPRNAVLPNVEDGARQQMGPLQPMIPSSVAGLQRTVAQRTSILSPLIPQRRPGKRQVAEIPVRWLIWRKK